MKISVLTVMGIKDIAIIKVISCLQLHILPGSELLVSKMFHAVAIMLVNLLVADNNSAKGTVLHARWRTDSDGVPFWTNQNTPGGEVRMFILNCLWWKL